MEVVHALRGLFQAVQPSLDLVNRELADEPSPESCVESAQAIFQISDVALTPAIELLQLQVFVDRWLN